MFLKYYHVERLWQILSNYEKLTTRIQTHVRAWLARRELCRLREQRRQLAATRIQAGGWKPCDSVLSVVAVGMINHMCWLPAQLLEALSLGKNLEEKCSAE